MLMISLVYKLYFTHFKIFFIVTKRIFANFFMVKRQTAWLSNGGENEKFEFYGRECTNLHGRNVR